MVDKNVDETKSGKVSDFLKELKDFALTVGEDCPEGHRRDSASGACLPISGLDHTAFTRSLNVEDGPQWRGLKDKTNDTFDNQDSISDRASEVAVDADVMEDRESCAEGMTFSFVQDRCIPAEEAEDEDVDEFAMTEEGSYIEEAKNGHEEVIALDPEGRKDTVNFECPPTQFFDRKLRECIPLNKDTVMASEDFSAEFKQAVATFARLALTSPDPIDGHRHVATLDEEGNGVTSVAGHMHPHSHEVKKFNVIPRTGKEEGNEYTSQHPGVAVPVEHRIETLEDFGSDEQETATPITSPQRTALPDSAFGVPGKRKFPLDTCARVRNAMARFNQAKGLNSGEKASLRRKILARAKACEIEVTNFAAAESTEDFRAVVEEMMPTKERVEATYAADNEQGPCPPGMVWASEAKRCNKSSGFIATVLETAQHSDIVAIQPVGRRDTVNHDCPPGEIFDFGNRKCIPMDTSSNPGQPGDTTKAAEEDAQRRVLTPQPEGRPVRLPIDCPAGTIWNKDTDECIPLDSSKKTKSEEEDAALPDFIQKIVDKKKGKNGDDKDKKKKGNPFGKKSKSEEDEDATSDGQTTPNGSGGKKGPGCPEGQFMNPVTKKCMPRKGAFKGKSEEEVAEHVPGNREGLTDAPAGRVKTPMECPPGTAWNAVRRVCSPLSTMDKNRPSGSAGPQDSKSVADDNQIENLSLAKVISHLDEIIRAEAEGGRKEKAKTNARELPNEAFPPSLVSSTRRALMHHDPEVSDPYDNNTVDVSRLRNALARVSKVDGFAEKAVEDATEHLLYHAREIVRDHLGKS